MGEADVGAAVGRVFAVLREAGRAEGTVRRYQVVLDRFAVFLTGRGLDTASEQVCVDFIANQTGVRLGSLRHQIIDKAIPAIESNDFSTDQATLDAYLRAVEAWRGEDDHRWGAGKPHDSEPAQPGGRPCRRAGLVFDLQRVPDRSGRPADIIEGPWRREQLTPLEERRQTRGREADPVSKWLLLPGRTSMRAGYVDVGRRLRRQVV